jgi:hypothetical protein
VLSFLITGILAAAGIFATTRTVSDVIDSVTTVQSQPSILLPTFILNPTDIPTATPVPATNLMMQFGSEGTGPGQFQDARHIAVDPDGNIYVADYDTGRLQKFDASGKFLQLVNVEANQNAYSFIMDMAVDYAGHLFVVRARIFSPTTPPIYRKRNPFLAGFPRSTSGFWQLTRPINYMPSRTASSLPDLIKMDSSGEVLDCSGSDF